MVEYTQNSTQHTTYACKAPVIMQGNRLMTSAKDHCSTRAQGCPCVVECSMQASCSVPVLLPVHGCRHENKCLLHGGWFCLSHCST